MEQTEKLETVEQLEERLSHEPKDLLERAIANEKELLEKGRVEGWTCEFCIKYNCEDCPFNVDTFNYPPWIKECGGRGVYRAHLATADVSHYRFKPGTILPFYIQRSAAGQPISSADVGCEVVHWFLERFEKALKIQEEREGWQESIRKMVESHCGTEFTKGFMDRLAEIGRAALADPPPKYPRVIWERGNFRIVQVDRYHILVERQDKDGMGVLGWVACKQINMARKVDENDLTTLPQALFHFIKGLILS